LIIVLCQLKSVLLALPARLIVLRHAYTHQKPTILAVISFCQLTKLIYTRLHNLFVFKHSLPYFYAIYLHVCDNSWRKCLHYATAKSSTPLAALTFNVPCLLKFLLRYHAHAPSLITCRSLSKILFSYTLSNVVYNRYGFSYLKLVSWSCAFELPAKLTVLVLEMVWWTMICLAITCSILILKFPLY
jgi:hypothetical protein